jgi:hypothetical protein
MLRPVRAAADGERSFRLEAGEMRATLAGIPILGFGGRGDGQSMLLGPEES